MEERRITVQVTLDERTFRRFALFDTFAVKRRGRGPALFSLILIASAVAALLTRRAQSGLIAAVLLAIGLGLPLVYGGTFLSQLSQQAKRFRLGKGRKVYAVTLAPEGIAVRNLQKKEDELRLPWDGLWRAWRRRGCVYLYATPARAFLLPEGQADVPDPEVWDFIRTRLGEEKCRPRGRRT